MITGFGGRLVSSTYLEHYLAATDPASSERAADRALATWPAQIGSLGPASSLRALLDAGAAPLAHALGFEAVRDPVLTVDGAAATLVTGQVRVALIVTPWGARLDPFWRMAIAEARRRGAAWCLVFNGTHLRLLHPARVTSQRFTEFDLELALDDDHGRAALRTLLRADAFHGAAAAGSVAALVAASDQHAVVTCRSLRRGVLAASEHVLRALTARRDAAIAAAFDQSLTIVYRLLFLFFAEARALVPAWHPVYRQSYSVERLRDSALRAPAVGLWDALRAISRLAHAGCRAGDLTVTPFNGRLFAPSRTPLVERRDLDDEAARQTLVALTTRATSDGEGREVISYRDLGVEELGGVYETLLDYAPHVAPAAPTSTRRRARVEISLQPGSGVRKDTGSFYTPQSIATYLVRRTLEPLVRDATPEQILRLRVLDPSMGSGAFLVAACGYLAEAYVAALIRAGGCLPGDIGPLEHARVRRTIAERCLFGVDVNPMAVQLARLSLWLTTLAADRPLSFLDHHLQTGDSVLGAWLSSLTHAPSGRTRRRDGLPLFDDEAVTSTVRHVLPVRFQLANDANDTPEQVRHKERALRSLADPGSELSKWRRIADLWCARWFTDDLASSTLFAPLVDRILAGRGPLPPATADRLLRLATDAAATHRFFHWELEFPEVFFDADGQRRSDAGFDAIIGNPPWDMVRADAGAPAARRAAQRTATAIVRFTRDAGVYQAQSSGHANRYQLFLERSIALTRAGGRLGLVLPSGIASDCGSAPLRQWLFTRTAVDALIGFDNRRAIFPIHRSVRFLLLTATAGTETAAIHCRFGEVDATVLDRIEDQSDAAAFPVRIGLGFLRTVSGDGLAVPDLRTPQDVAIVERAAALFAPLASEAGWRARFGRELNATDDRAHFTTSGRGLPVVGGRHLDAFHAHVEKSAITITARDAQRLLGVRHERRRLAYRDVASATNRMTLIAALLPAHVVSTHTLFCLQTPLATTAQHFLCGLFNSFVVNYLVRMRVATHVTTAMVERLPIPREDQAGAAFRSIAAAARFLSRRDDPRVRASLQAQVARLYELELREFAAIVGTFPLVPVEDRDQAVRAFAEA